MAGIAGALCGLGVVFYRLQRYPESIEYQEKGAETR